jgi:hypothetical protein
MNATAVYSKSGKGVQEAAGKTSQLSRPDRAVLAAIDGRASLADVAQKVGRAFDNTFKLLIAQLDRDGFIREVSSASAAAGPAASRPAAPARPAGRPSAPTAPLNPDSDLDFTVTMPAAKRSAPLPPPQPPPRAPAPPPKAINVPPPPPPPSAEDKAKAERIAREQQAAMARAREEAERKAADERDRLKAEAEAKARTEAEARARADADVKARDAAAQAAHAAREAAVREAARVAAEARAKAEAEVRRAREEAERVRREAEEKLQREREQLEEERRKLEEERRQREEQARRQEAEQAMRRAREEEEERARRRQREEEEAAAADIRRKIEEKNSEHARKGEAPAPPPPPSAPPAYAAPPPAKTGDAFADSLLADLDSFNTREEEEERKRQAEDQERSAQQAAARREAEARQAQELAERQKKDDKARKKEEKERLAREEEERAAQAKREADERIAQEEARRKEEEEDRKRKAKEEERLASRATQTSSSYNESVDQRRRKESQLFSSATGRHRAERKKTSWGRTLALLLAIALVGGLAVLHFVPLPTAEYERAASQALGRRVKIGSANYSLVTGLQLKFSDVSVGDARVGRVRAYPELGALLGGRKAFSRIELEGLTLPPDSLGDALFAGINTGNFSVARVLAQDFKVDGALPLPPLAVELVYGPDGVVRSASVRGPDGLVAKLVPKGGEVQFDLTANRFTLPIAQEITLAQFGMKGSATRSSMNITAWDGELYNGTLSGTARLRWGGTWNLDGAITARGVNAAVFAPALLSDGRLEGTGRFSMSGAEPAKLARGGRLEGSFTVNKGVLGSFDLSRAIQTAGKQSTGSTRFAEMSGQGVYDRGAVALRNVTIGAGALNAGASADIAQTGALSGRIVADVRTASQTLRATLVLGGTVKEPQVRN